MLPSHDIAALLEDNGIGTMGTDIFVNDEPPDPDNCVTIYDTGGASGPVTNAKTYKEPTIQIRVRNRRYSDGYEKASLIQSVMESNSRSRYSPSGESYNYTALYKVTEILNLPRDESSRTIFVQNFRCPRND